MIIWDVATVVVSRDRNGRTALFIAACMASISVGNAGGAGAQVPQSLVCDEVEQSYIVKQTRLQDRDLDFFLFGAAARGCEALVRRFLDLGASTEARDRVGNTALLLAAKAGKKKIVRALIEEGARHEHKNLSGDTAILLAAIANRRGVVKQLIKIGADPNIGNKRGVTPLMAAAFNGNGAICAILLQAGADPAPIDAAGKTAAIYAAARGFYKVLALLLDANADVNQRAGNGLTALMWTAGHSNDVPSQDALATLNLLLARGAMLDLADNRGRTALMTAAVQGHAGIAARLLDAGADRSPRDKNGKTARDLSADEKTRDAFPES